MDRKVLFVHDGPLDRLKNTEKYYGIIFTNEIIERYRFFGERVNFMMRVNDLSKDDISNRYSQLTSPNFGVINVPNFKSVNSANKAGEAKCIIKAAVQAHDVIIARLPSAIGRIAFEEAIKLNKPVLVEFVACVWDALWNYNWQGKLLAPLRFMQYRKLMQKAKHTLYVTDQFLQKRYPSPGKSVGCSDVLLYEFDDQVVKDRIRRIQEDKNNELILGTIAAIDVPYKGQVDVIRAISKLRSKGITVKYHIVGQGNPKRLQSVINDLNLNDQVKIIGPLSHKDIFSFLDSISVYIQPSRQEGLPRAVVEAMSRGCPCIGTDIAGIPELINPECLYSKYKPSDMIPIIKKMQDEEFIVSQVKQMYSRSKDFSQEKLDRKRIDFYEEFMKDYRLSIKCL